MSCHCSFGTVSSSYSLLYCASEEEEEGSPGATQARKALSLLLSELFYLEVVLLKLSREDGLMLFCLLSVDNRATELHAQEFWTWIYF